MSATGYSRGTARTGQGLASQNNVGYYAENNQYIYQEYLLNSNRSYENSQNILRTTLEDLEDTLGNLEGEFHQVIAGGNPDRMEEFVRKSLNTYQEDMVYAKRNRAITKD